MNDKSFIKVILAVLTIALSGTAQSQNGFFAYGGIGSSDTDFSPSANHFIDDGDTSFELGVGYDLTDHLSIQGGYQDLGSPTGVSVCPPNVNCITQFVYEKVDVDGWSVTLAARQALADSIEGFVRLGVIAWDASASNPMLSKSGNDLLYGAGLAWQLDGNWGLQIAYEKVDIDIQSFRLGARFRF